MRWLHDFITEMTCYLRLRGESKVTLGSFREVEEEGGRVVLTMFIDDGEIDIIIIIIFLCNIIMSY